MTDQNDKQKENSYCGCGGGDCCSGPGKWIWILLAVAIAGVLIAKNAGEKQRQANTPVEGEMSAAVEGAVQTKALPRLVDLGAKSCVPCKMMAPILQEIGKEYASVFRTQFIDVWQNQSAGQQYGIRVIPTQIFFDAEGKELFRHEGFMSKEDILNTWTRLGVDITQKTQQ